MTINSNNGKGFIVTALCLIIAIIFAILVPTFSSMAFFCRDWARVDSLRQQASYNAASGIEYARFILENSPAIFDPLDPTGEELGKAAWPIQGPIQCVNGTATIIMTMETGGIYKISSTGTLGTITATTQARYMGGDIEEWS